MNDSYAIVHVFDSTLCHSKYERIEKPHTTPIWLNMAAQQLTINRYEGGRIVIWPIQTTFFDNINKLTNFWIKTHNQHALCAVKYVKSSLNRRPRRVYLANAWSVASSSYKLKSSTSNKQMSLPGNDIT